MSVYKQGKDYLVKFVLGSKVAPQGLVELNRYFRMYDPISFRQERQADGSIVAVSQNFRYGSIVTHAQRPEELEEKIIDAILTAMDVPSSYAKEAGIRRVAGVGREEYALA